MTATVKVKPWGEGQGEYVIINANDLTKAHELFDAPTNEAGGDDRKAERAALFAFLKENGVTIAKNATDDALRAKVEEIKAAAKQE